MRARDTHPRPLRPPRLPARVLGVVGAGACLLGLARAMIFFATGDPSHNTSPPTGELADSGWQWQGNWRGFAGTPIGTNWFLTAKHLGGSVGDEFLFEGERYRTTAFFDDSMTDLRLWRVCRPFPSFAPLYGAPDESGRTCVLFGRGLARGAEVTQTNTSEQAELRGWQWGAHAGQLRWGLNRITSYEDYGNATAVLLRSTFDATGGSDEAMLTGGDSGGGVFIQRAGQWELAGIAYAVDGPFRYAADGAELHAALFDRRGFYEQSEEGWTQIPPTPLPRPAALYASRVSARRAWLEEVMTTHPQPEAEPVLLAGALPDGPFDAVPAEVDSEQREVRSALPRDPAVFQLSACRPLRIVKYAVIENELVLHYE